MNKALLEKKLRYDKDTGVFVWLTGKWAGKPAGTLNSSGYIRVVVDGKQYQAHRLAFLLLHGALPDKDVDHINGQRNDNRWENLRVVDRATNMANRTRPNKNNVAGLLGASKRRDNCWVAQIREKGVTHYLGAFKTPQEASAAYAAAKKGVHFAHSGQ